MVTKSQTGLRSNSLNVGSLIFYTLFVLFWLTSASASLGSTNTEVRDYRFDVYYNGKRIGEHEFLVRRTDQEIRVQSRAQFEFRMLFVPVYRYEHIARERWVAGCLQTLAARTNDNGELFEINMQPQQGELLLSRLAPSSATVAVDDPCPASYAYWDLELLRRGELINTQTGEIMSAKLTDQGVEERDGVLARRFTLNAETGTIELWYRESDSRWIALETVRDGGTLAYRAGA